jgi:serine/threonine protein kinase
MQCVLLPDKDHVAVPAREDNPQLRSLLHNLLQADPRKRLSAEEALVHPFFSTSMMDEVRALALPFSSCLLLSPPAFSCPRSLVLLLYCSLICRWLTRIPQLHASGQLLGTERKFEVFRKFLNSLKADRGWYDYEQVEHVVTLDPKELVEVRLLLLSLCPSVCFSHVI